MPLDRDGRTRANAATEMYGAGGANLKVGRWRYELESERGAGERPAMSERWCRRALWFSLVLLLPLPSWVFGVQWIPVAFLVELGVPVLWIFARDGGYVASTAAAVMTTQAILWAAILFFVSGRLVRAWPHGRRAPIAAGIGVLLLVLAVALPIYQTGFVYDGRPVNLVGLFR